MLGEMTVFVLSVGEVGDINATAIGFLVEV